MAIGIVEHLQGLGRYVSYYPGFNHITGHVFASILLYELIYQDYVRSKYRPEDITPDGIAINEQEWMEELGLSRCELRTAREHLRSRGLITETTKGMPRRIYYKLEREAINTNWQNYLETQQSAIAERRAEFCKNHQTENARQSNRQSQSDVEQLTSETLDSRQSQSDVEQPTSETLDSELVRRGTADFLFNDLKTKNSFFKPSEPENKRERERITSTSQPKPDRSDPSDPEPPDPTIESPDSLASQKLEEPKPTGQDNYSAAPNSLQKKEIHPCEQMEARLRQGQLPWQGDVKFEKFLTDRMGGSNQADKVYRASRMLSKAREGNQSSVNAVADAWKAYQQLHQRQSATSPVIPTAIPSNQTYQQASGLEDDPNFQRYLTNLKKRYHDAAIKFGFDPETYVHQQLVRAGYAVA